MANLFLGIADAWESGAKDSYFLSICFRSNLDYKLLKVSITKYLYVINFCLALVSTILYNICIYLPMVLTAIFYGISTVVLLKMPNDHHNSTEFGKTRDFFSVSIEVLQKLLKNRMLLLEMGFTTVCTSILISNFDFYALIFENAGIAVSLIGAIYSSFKIINMMGVKMYELNRKSAILRLPLLIMPCSFILLIKGDIPLVLAGVFLQELCFSYYNIDFNISVIDSIDDFENSSYYQSVISFLTALLRIILTSIITLLFKWFKMDAVYYMFMACTFFVTVTYFTAKEKSCFQDR
jgi:hypothetical protein